MAVHQAEAQTPAQHADVHVVPASTEERPAAVVAAQPQSSFEARFFADCSDRPRIRVHSDSSAGDAHAVLYTAGNLMELEVIRLADLVIDLPIGRGVRPLERTVDGIRAGYDRLGHQLLLRRFGEFVDALQIRELSLGDAAATYSGGTGGAVSPGSGTVVRVDKLIDWVQHVTGDVNGGLGLLAGRPAGLVSWRLPGRAVDQAQLGVIRVFHLVSVTVARALDRGVAGVEDGLEVVLNLSRPEAHRRTTVFVRVPLEIYQAHQAWIGRQGRRIYAGSAEELRGLTHAELFHGRGKRWVPARAQWPTGTSHIILVMSARTFTSAPPALAPYVIPAAWVGQEPEPSDQI